MSRRSIPRPWPGWELQDSRAELCKLRDTLDNLPPEISSDIETYLSRFLVIRSCGHIEYSLDKATSLLVHEKASPDVHNYVETGLFKGRSPRPGRLVESVTRFSRQWGIHLEEKLDADDGLLRRELEFLVDRRNKIAHGQSESIGRRKALSLCDYALVVANEILDLMNPASKPGDSNRA